MLLGEYISFSSLNLVESVEWEHDSKSALFDLTFDIYTFFFSRDDSLEFARVFYMIKY